MHKIKGEITMLYNIWGFVRQSAVRIYLAGAKAIYKISGGKLPKSLYCKRANPEKIPTHIPKTSRNITVQIIIITTILFVLSFSIFTM